MKKLLREQLRLYLITGPYGKHHRSLYAAVEKAAAYGVTMVQLRDKGRTTEETVELGLMMKKVTDHAGIPLIINDDYDRPGESNRRPGTHYWRFCKHTH